MPRRQHNRTRGRRSTLDTATEVAVLRILALPEGRRSFAHFVNQDYRTFGRLGDRATESQRSLRVQVNNRKSYLLRNRETLLEGLASHEIVYVPDVVPPVAPPPPAAAAAPPQRSPADASPAFSRFRIPQDPQTPTTIPQSPQTTAVATATPPSSSSRFQVPTMSSVIDNHKFQLHIDKDVHLNPTGVVVIKAVGVVAEDKVVDMVRVYIALHNVADLKDKSGKETVSAKLSDDGSALIFTRKTLVSHFRNVDEIVASLEADEKVDQLTVQQKAYVTETSESMVAVTYLFPKGMTCNNEHFNVVDGSPPTDPYKLVPHYVITNKLLSKNTQYTCTNIGAPTGNIPGTVCGKKVKCECGHPVMKMPMKMDAQVFFDMAVDSDQQRYTKIHTDQSVSSVEKKLSTLGLQDYNLDDSSASTFMSPRELQNVIRNQWDASPVAAAIRSSGGSSTTASETNLRIPQEPPTSTQKRSPKSRNGADPPSKEELDKKEMDLRETAAQKEKVDEDVTMTRPRLDPDPETPDSTMEPVTKGITVKVEHNEICIDGGTDPKENPKEVVNDQTAPREADTDMAMYPDLHPAKQTVDPKEPQKVDVGTDPDPVQLKEPEKVEMGTNPDPVPMKNTVERGTNTSPADGTVKLGTDPQPTTPAKKIQVRLKAKIAPTVRVEAETQPILPSLPRRRDHDSQSPDIIDFGQADVEVKQPPKKKRVVERTEQEIESSSQSVRTVRVGVDASPTLPHRQNHRKRKPNVVKTHKKVDPLRGVFSNPHKNLDEEPNEGLDNVGTVGSDQYVDRMIHEVGMTAVHGEIGVGGLAAIDEEEEEE